jgi:uncharacterized coiled-coil DUF342 family protein
MKEAYEKKVEAQMAEWKSEIDKMKAKADKADADAKIAYYKEIDALRSKQKAAQEKLEELKAAGGDAWKDLKSGIDLALDSMAESLKSAASRFK